MARLLEQSKESITLNCDLLRDKYIRFKHGEVNEKIIMSFKNTKSVCII